MVSIKQKSRLFSETEGTGGREEIGRQRSKCRTIKDCRGRLGALTDHAFAEVIIGTVVKFQLTVLSSPGTVAKMSNDEAEPGKTELDSMRSQEENWLEW